MTVNSHIWMKQSNYENNLMPGDEVVFFFRFDKHVWEILFKKKISWDEDLYT